MSDGNSTLTQARLKELLRYDPDTGLFTRLGKALGPGFQNRPAGGVRELGYVMIRVDGERHRAHRLAWLYMTGRWPEQHIDHIDGNPGNNRFVNLRDVPRTVNAQNAQKPTGVEYRAGRRSPWRVRLLINGERRTIGHYRTEEEAAAAREAAKLEHHPGYVPATRKD